MSKREEEYGFSGPGLRKGYELLPQLLCRPKPKPEEGHDDSLLKQSLSKIPQPVKHLQPYDPAIKRDRGNIDIKSQISNPTADPPASVQQTTSWTFVPDDISSDLMKLFQTLETQRNTVRFSTVNSRIAPSRPRRSDASALVPQSGPDNLSPGSYDDDQVRVARYWELECKAVTAEPPSASPAGLRERRILFRGYRTATARRLEEALRSPPAKAGGRAGGDGPTSHKSKFEVNESDGTGGGVCKAVCPERPAWSLGVASSQQTRPPAQLCLYWRGLEV
ncbi:hypothetical protein GUITHDRAFT_114563 [Guillardia theta CCMP2712]|uniref:Uncharacterized protein n=1 Tax=Guillardia theta (strain CCMP2712) TaxID=905079 RepID=L1ISY5_GUITC|nr:hypothetical protein GUITHDRAFT_114563 [Guillardia theta CCMP2712]EKX39366.1 hypothetical protein GUITHDRAFT_114563 [Guillardia theta CCMP2712]|eukprot:XP_005826346.1 hypothetical protein GUITHDRAFT_114563 [Guillardia theta CCMP2712]